LTLSISALLDRRLDEGDHESPHFVVTARVA